jgi:hypothetical protein
VGEEALGYIKGEEIIVLDLDADFGRKGEKMGL